MQMRLLARWLARWIGGAGLLLATQACVAHDTAPVNPGYGYGFAARGGAGFEANVSVGEPSPYYVSSMPPEPLYEQMTSSPGDGSVWIDGYWHWNGYEWVWVNGRWEHEQPGYVYVEPSYDYVADQYVYTPGYWAVPDRVPRGWVVRDHRDGRPTSVAPPAGSGGYRPPAGATGTAGVHPRPGDPGGEQVFQPPGHAPITRPNHPVAPPGTLYHPPADPPVIFSGQAGSHPPAAGATAGQPVGTQPQPTTYAPGGYRPPAGRQPPPSWHPVAPPPQTSAPIWVNPSSPRGPVGPAPSVPPGYHPGPAGPVGPAAPGPIYSHPTAPIAPPVVAPPSAPHPSAPVAHPAPAPATSAAPRR
jgi:hypothetical protein